MKTVCGTRVALGVLLAAAIALVSSGSAVRAQDEMPGMIGMSGTVVVTIDSLAPGAVVGESALLAGWAADLASVDGTGVTDVEIYVDSERGARNAQLLGRAVYGEPRPNAATAAGDRFLNSGYTLWIDTRFVADGEHTFFVYARKADGSWVFVSEPIAILPPRPGGGGEADD